MAELPTQRDFEDFSAWTGRDVLGPDGNRLGTVELIFLDEATDRPEWVLVRLDGEGGDTFVPLAGASVEERAIRVEQDRERVAAAPRFDVDDTLTVDEERRLYDHYGLAYSQDESSTVLPEGATSESPSGSGTTAPQPAPAAGRPRLRRYTGGPGMAAAAGTQGGTPTSGATGTGADPDAAARIPDDTASGDSPGAASERGSATGRTPADSDATAEESTAETTSGPAPGPDGPSTTGTGPTDGAAADPIPGPAPRVVPPEGGFQVGEGGDADDGGPLAALKRRPAIPAVLAGAIAGLIAVLALRRRR